jgi:hypothetical protein
MAEGSNEELSDFMEQSPCEADGLLAGSEIFRGFIDLEIIQLI